MDLERFKRLSNEYENQQVFLPEELKRYRKAMEAYERTLVVGMMQTPPYDRMFEQSRRMYSAKGISPTLHTQGGGNQEIKVLVKL